MTTVDITNRSVTSTAVALLLPGEPMPPPRCTDPSMPACNLCDRPTDQLWPLATAPAEDELLAGELLICRSCAEAVRPPTSAATTTTQTELAGPTMSDPGPAPTLTY